MPIGLLIPSALVTPVLRYDNDDLMVGGDVAPIPESGSIFSGISLPMSRSTQWCILHRSFALE